MIPVRAVAVLTVVLCACRPASVGRRSDHAPADLVASAQSFYKAYEQALKTGDKARLGPLYHPAGAHIVVNGRPTFWTRAGLDSAYRNEWTQPTFFTWDSLRFEAHPPTRVLVYGRFRWAFATRPDTTAFAYVSILEMVDSTLAIRFEHETRLAR